MDGAKCDGEVIPALSAPVRILIVEDHAILRAGLRAMLELESDFKVVDDVPDAAEAEASVRRHSADLVITDLNLPLRSGADLIRSLRAWRPLLKFLVLTAHSSQEHIRTALAAGAHGYVLKDSPRSSLLESIRSVAAGLPFLCPKVSARVMQGFVGHHTVQDGGHDGRVTHREQEVLTLIADGQGNKQIAHLLGISVKTVEKHRFNVMHKLALRNTAEVTRYAMEHGMLPDGSTAAYQAVDYESSAWRSRPATTEAGCGACRFMKMATATGA